ncbi:MAG TPA: anion permease, partial [Rheinheimera sp.]|nr:anion permease [Rheinheimera sp.]
PAAVAASCAFMMPVATPPNAIIFASGKLKIIDMVKAGLVLNLCGIVLITAFVMLIARSVFNF